MNEPTRLPPPGDPATVYVLDLNCWVYRFYATMRGGAASGWVEFLGKLMRDRRPSHLVICADLPFPNWRHDLAPKRTDGSGYKAQRTGPDATLLERLRWSRELAEDVHGIPILSKRGWEADDMIAAVAHRAGEAGMRTVIVGLDKDLLQLVKPDGSCLMWDGKQQVWGRNEVFSKFRIEPGQLRDYLAIVGDTADNVPGIRGAGPQAAVEILHACVTLDDALDIATGAAPATDEAMALFKRRPKYQRMLAADPEAARLSQRLVSLDHNVPLSSGFEEMKR